MKKVIIFVVVGLVGLYIYFQWKKRANATKEVNTDIPQNNASNLSNVNSVRQDSVTSQDVIDKNNAFVNGSSTSDNPVTRENNQPIPITEHLSNVTVAGSPGVPLQPVLGANSSIQIENTPIVSDSIVNGVDQFTNSGGITPSPSGDVLISNFTGTDGVTQYQYKRPNGDTYTTTVKAG